MAFADKSIIVLALLQNWQALLKLVAESESSQNRYWLLDDRFL